VKCLTEADMAKLRSFNSFFKPWTVFCYLKTELLGQIVLEDFFNVCFLPKSNQNYKNKARTEQFFSGINRAKNDIELIRTEEIE